MKENCIEIICRDDNPQIRKGVALSNLLTKQLSLDTFKSSLLDFVCKINDALADLNLKVKNYDLEEIEMTIEVSASGGVSLIGAIEAEATGGITLKFKRC